jgi:hypothetical protein
MTHGWGKDLNRVSIRFFLVIHSNFDIVAIIAEIGEDQAGTREQEWA